MTHQYCALYRARNLANGKEYYGVSVNPKRRWSRHKTVAKKAHTSEFFAFARAINKYGADAFSFDVVLEEHGPDAVAKCKDAEVLAIELFESQVPNGYNITAGGEGTSGLKLTEKQVTALKVRVKGQWETSREKMMASLTSDEFKAKISVTSTAYANQPEVKARVSKESSARANDPVVKAKQTLVFKEAANRPDVKARLVVRMVARNARPEIKAAMSGKNSFRARAVVCSNGMRFDTMAQAVEWLRSIGFTKAASASLHHPLRDPSRVAYGFHWQYATTNKSLEKEMA